jgi:hypothetical protein
MSILSPKQIEDIGKQVARYYQVPVVGISSSSAIDADGDAAVRIVVSITPGSSARVIGLPSANMTSQFIEALAEGGEDRFPLTTFREDARGAT